MSDSNTQDKKAKGGSIFIIVLVMGILTYVGYNHFTGASKTEAAKADSTKVATEKVKADSIAKSVIIADTTKKIALVVDTTKKKEAAKTK